MSARSSPPHPTSTSAAALRRSLSAHNLALLANPAAPAHEQTFATTPSILYAPADDTRSHGNFLDASYRRILANPAWRARLNKAYTGGRRIPRTHDRPFRAELDCANSSDALLMNVFCYPRLLAAPALCRLLGLAPRTPAEFGLRAHLPLLPKPNHTEAALDRTEIDLRLGDLLLEAKLTESNFQTAPARLVHRYRDLEAVFDLNDLPRSPTGAFLSYQLLRGALAAHATGARFAVLLDARRHDLAEQWFAVLRAVRSADLRSRLQLITWQELAAATPPRLRNFLATKYGIVPR